MLKEKLWKQRKNWVRWRLNPYFNGTCSKSALSLQMTSAKLISLNPYFNGTCSKSLYSARHPRVCPHVLILILMEHAQRAAAKWSTKLKPLSLNPYFNGTCSKSMFAACLGIWIWSLNPYFNGTCSKSLCIIRERRHKQ